MDSDRSRRIALGLYLLVVSVYLLSGPGRIDIVDGQIRFEMADSFLRVGRPILRDPVVRQYGTLGIDGEAYGRTGTAASIAGLPLVALGALTDDPRGETRRFLFSWTSAFLGALIAPVLFLFYRRLDIDSSRAVAWVLVASFATLVWPLATSTFDQAQHAALILLSLYLSFRSGQQDSLPLAAAAGLVGGLLFNYQENYVLLLPFLALASLDGRASRGRVLARLTVFASAALVGLGLWMLYNWLYFADPLTPGRLRPGFFRHPSSKGSILVGLAGLLLSPGKSLFLYCPTVLLGFLGWRRLKQKQTWLAMGILLASLTHVIFIARLPFWHGDWSWGPRYLVILLPLWALAFPFAVQTRARKWLAAVLVTLGLTVQFLGLSLVHERFFHERGLGGFFWASDPAFYFRDSALFSRPREIRETTTEGMPDTARYFSNTPELELSTYFIRGFAPPETGPMLMRHFQVFYLPRPWPLWLPRLDTRRYDPPVNGAVLVPLLLLTGLSGGLLVFRAGDRGDGLRGRAP